MDVLAGGVDLSLKVKGAPLLLRVDSALERRRANLFTPLLITHGATRQKAGRFPYGLYQELRFDGRCFDNAMETAMRYRLTYMEGLMLLTLETGEEFPLAHGWCLDGAGSVVDPTCHKYQHHESITYYGLPIDTQYSINWRQCMGYFGCLDGAPDGRPCGPYVDAPRVWLADVTQKRGGV